MADLDLSEFIPGETGTATRSARGDKVPPPPAPPTDEAGSPAVWTLLGEAGSDPVHILPVAATIINRQKKSGAASPDAVVTDTGNGYEAWTDAKAREATKRKYPVGSPAYEQAQETLQEIEQNGVPDQFKGFDTFYSPNAQSQKGRAKPKWDDGSGVNIGGNVFFADKYAAPKAGEGGSAGDAGPSGAPGDVDLSSFMDTGPPPGEKPTPKKPTPLGQARAAPPPHQFKPTPFLPNAADIPKDVGHQFMEGVRANEAESKVPFNLAGEDMPLGPFGSPRGIKQATNTLASIASPITGLAESVIGRPVAAVANAVNDRFHIAPKMEADPEAIGNIASMALGGAGELGEARTAAKAGQTVDAYRAAEAARSAAPKVLPQSNALKAQLAARDPEYAARVDRLHRLDVDLMPGQIKGGEAKIREQQDTSSRTKGEAVREGQQKALKSYNRAGYNEALAPIGERYDPKGPIGRAGIDEVASKIGAVYDRVLPQARLKADQEVADRISEIREDNEGLLGPYKDALNGIIQSRIIKRLDADHSMDGRTFKEVESELSTLSRKYHQSQDGAQHILGDAIDELNGALRDNMERNSPANIRPELKKANAAWAAYKRLEAASERRPTSMGIFTPGDLQQAAKIGNRGGSFARGKALLGQFADDGQAVLGNIVPDSGTAGRLNRTGRGLAGALVGEVAGSTFGHGPIGGAIGAAVGGMADRYAGSVTNNLARSMLSREAARATGRATTPHNYLRAAQQRALAPRTPLIAGAAGQAGEGQQ